MADTDDVFDLIAHCAGCGMEYRFELEDNDQTLEFTSWGLSMLQDHQH